MSELQQQPSSPEMETPPATPRIYVASLADYNAGRLHGSWLDAARNPEDLQADIAAMLVASPEPNAEEWAIHGHDGFGGLRLDEYERLDTIAELASGLAQHGEAFVAFAAWVGTSEATVERFDNTYWGQWDSRETFGEELLTDLGATRLLEELPAMLQRYLRFDYSAFVHDLEIDGDIHTVDLSTGQVAVFEGG
ncbi:MAG: antirestriction protein ArdA [Frankiaceae bacterium]